ncbi:MAG TPA: ABC transporter ATP-binding protein [Gaiellaceae bacterium]|nr:ABC transporter ATP-binding protein [Gaiellaceae bacterium]
MALLEVHDLHVRFRTRDGIVRAVDGASFSVDRGRTLGIVGESGSGKTVSALTVLGLTRAPNATIEGRVLLDGVDLLELPAEELRHIRGKRIAMIFQDPMSSLHPLYRVGWQIVEAIRAHEDVSGKVARRRALEALREVGIPAAAERLYSYPHELSGGMRQRVMIAMALVLDPDVLIADEPTTALDVTVQAQILDLISALQDERKTGVVLITHDLGVVAETADEVVVMYAGRVAEHAPVETILAAPEHPYTWGLLQSAPRVEAARSERLRPIPGRPPSLIHVPSGCPFHPRCSHAFEVCPRVEPELLESGPGHVVACHLPVVKRRAIGRELVVSRRAAS